MTTRGPFQPKFLSANYQLQYATFKISERKGITEHTQYLKYNFMVYPPLGPQRQIWLCVHLKLVLYVTGTATSELDLHAQE